MKKLVLKDNKKYAKDSRNKNSIPVVQLDLEGNYIAEYESIFEKHNEVLETMYHAILTAVNNRDIDKRINTNKIVENLNLFNEEILEYVSTINSIGNMYNDLDIDDVLKELKLRIK